MKLNILISLFIPLIVVFVYLNKFTIFYPLFVDSMYQYDTRVGFGSMSCFVFSAPTIILAIKLKYLDNNWRIAGIAAIGLIIISSIINESRMLIIAIGFNIMVAYVFSYYFSERKLFVIRMIKGITIILLFGFAVSSLYNYSNPDSENKIQAVVNRFTESMQTGKIMSFEVRKFTNEITWREIVDRPLGFGLGSEISLYDVDGTVAARGSFIDNGALTMMHKVGILGFVIVLSFYFKEFWTIFRLYRRDKESFSGLLALCLLFCLPMFLLNGFYFTAQIFITNEMIAYTMIIFAIMDIRSRDGKMTA